MTPKHETSGYTVTLVKQIEHFINKYATFSEANYSLPIALWIMATYAYDLFDAFPYMTITADTKRSGKTRLAELIAFACHVPCFSGAMTPAAMFSTIEETKPTMFFDEAETLSSEGQNTLSAMLNMGYRKGSKIMRKHGNEVLDFNVYCPKVFVLIGDVRDTLKDRSIIVRMKRAEPRERFTWSVAEMEGAELRREIEHACNVKVQSIGEAFEQSKGITFLTDRDEEIWTPLFIMAQIFAPERIKELERTAIDMATEKTQESKRYVNMLGAEEAAQDDEYAVRLLKDLATVMPKGEIGISSNDAVAALKAIDIAPWRKYRGEGLTVLSMAEMLSRFGVSPKAMRLGKGKRGDNKNVFKGYKAVDVKNALQDRR